jgi:Tol biopolymer transport system component
MQSINSTNPVLETGATIISFSRRGTLAYAAGGIVPNEERSLLWLDKAGHSEPLEVPPGPYYTPQISRDGMLVALQTARDLWVNDLGRDSRKRLALQGAASYGIWGPDDRELVFLQEPDDSPPGLFRQSVDGSGSAQRLSTGAHFPSSWSEDGRTLAFVSDDDLWTLSLGDSKIERITETPFREAHPVFSPDGNWLAYTSTETGQDEVYVRAVPGTGGAYPVSTTGGHSPTWARTGRELYYLKAEPPAGQYVTDVMAVEVSYSPRFSASRPRRLFGRPLSTTYPIRNYDVSADGRFLVLTPYVQETQQVTKLQVVLNWFEELKRLAPAED